MNKEDLIEYKKKLARLSENEKKERDLYLKKIASGEIQGPQTGYPSIDKPWLKYYSDTAITSELPKCSMYQMIYNNNKNHLDNNAIQYFDKFITYREFFKNVDSVAKSLKNIGIKSGDIINVSLPNIPESAYIVYAISKIGAVANMIDPRSSVKDIKHYVNEVDSQYFILLDDILTKIEQMLDDTPLKNIITINAANSLLNTTDEVISTIHNDVNVYNYNSFINLGKDYNDEIEEDYIPDRGVVIEHTGGTTGTPKGVLLSNDAVNLIAHHFMISGLKFDRNQKWLNIMPPFIAYGVSNGLHLPLSVGMCVVAIPKFEPDKIDELIVKYQPNNFTGVPIHYESIIKSNKLKDADFSKWVLPGVGGDTMDVELEKRANEFLKNHNSPTRVIKGYGLTEVCAAACVTFGEANEYGSVGIPFVNNNISVFESDDNENYKELGCNELGEICISSPSVMLKYFANEKETNHVLKRHADGKLWMHTGDVGYMDNNGLVYIDGRTKRIIVRYDGFKIYPFGIEKAILSIPEVEACKVVSIPDTNHIQGNLPQANIIIKPEFIDDAEKIIEKIKKVCKETLAEYIIPSDYQIVDEFPRTPIGKVDYVAMEEQNKKKYKRLIK